MNMGAVLIGFLNVVLFCAIVIFIAFVILWILQTVFGITIDGNVLKWGKIIVALICVIAVLGWLLSLLGMAGGGVYTPRFFR